MAISVLVCRMKLTHSAKPSALKQAHTQSNSVCTAHPREQDMEQEDYAVKVTGTGNIDCSKDGYPLETLLYPGLT